MRHFKTLALRSTATVALLGALSFSAAAQVSITEDTSGQIQTSTAGAGNTPSDVTIGAEADGTTPRVNTMVTVDGERAGVVLDSDNTLNLAGTVTSNNQNGSTGVELQGGDNRSYTQSGDINLIEDLDPQNTDSDPFSDGRVAEGEGRTGILISGASPFRGNIELEATSSVIIEGNDSFGINLANTPMMTDGLTGNLLTAGNINITGDRSTGINLASNVTGNVENRGSIAVRGEGAEAYAVSGDIQGGFVNNGALEASGFRFTQRLGFGGEQFSQGREDLGAEDLRQAGSALRINGNVSGGVLLNQRFVASLDADGAPNLDTNGNPIFNLAGTSSITQFGSAPAVLINGEGAPIAIGLVAEITDPTDSAFDEDLQFGFINQGAVGTSGVFNDFDATTVSLSNVTFAGGISNTGDLTANTFRSPTATDLTSGDGVARVLVLGDQAIADRINNSGMIVAATSEDVEEIFFDRTNIIAPRELLAVGIDIGNGASVTELINTGSISAVLTGRDGKAVAIRDASGTLRTISNTGSINALGRSSDSLGLENVDLDFIAIDLSAATADTTFTQSQSSDRTGAPVVLGDINFGSGNDSLIASAGTIIGDVDFGGGTDTLTLSGGTSFTGALRNSDSLALSVTDGSTLALGAAGDIQVSEALVDGTSVFRPVINGLTGTASTLTSAGDITFEAGAAINPILNSIIGTDTFRYELATAGNLTIGDLASLSAGVSPFLYDTQLQLEGDNTLVVTLDLRDPNISVADGGLGLDQVQAAAFGQFVDGTFEEGAVFQALASSPTLGNTFSNITEADDFIAAYNQVLPEFSGAAHQFVLANVDGAVGAVSSHLDATRRSPDKSGGAWIQEFFYFADREKAGLSEQYRGEGFGFAGGLDTSFGPFHAVGANVSFASTEVEDVIGSDEPLDVRTYQLGTYAGYESNGFSVDAYGGLGVSEFEQTRRISIDNFTGSAEGKWSGLHANGAIRAGYTLPINKKFWARPTLSLDYLYLNEYGRTETGTQGLRLRVDGRQTETAAATAMLNFGTEFQGKRTWIRPSVRVGYRNEFLSDPVETAFRFQGLQSETGELFDSELANLRAFAFPDEGIILGFTMAAGSQYSSIGFDFDSDIRDGFIRHTGRIVIRLLF